MSGIWRRLRSVLGGEPAPAAPTSPQEPYVPNLPYVTKETPPSQESRPPDSPTATGRLAATPSAESGPESSLQPPTAVAGDVAGLQPSRVRPPTPVKQLAESLATRMTKDETLRGSLTDEEFQPLLDWALGRIGELARSSSPLPPAKAEATFELAGDRLLDLLRVIDVAVGERTRASPDVVLSRLQMLDTFLLPPLFDEQAASRAGARLEALLARPPARLQSTNGPDLTRWIVEALS